MQPERVVITLAGETDFDGFRGAARRLLGDGVEPDRATWTVRDGSAVELFALGSGAGGAGGAGGVEGAAVAGTDDAPDRGGGAVPTVVPGPAVPAAADPPAGAPAAAFAPRVPADFIELCRSVVLHSDRTRFALLYRLLWRLQREPGLRHDALDADAALARLMAQAVRRDLHKMKAFVRFREVARGALDGVVQPPLHVAWFEPDHHIVDAAAPFFVRRFTAMPWAILTPERCLSWDGQALTAGPGASRQDAPAADAGEALWLTYYESIFNPARLKLRAMEAEMPRRYWRNLPEARLISTLSAAAHERTGQMVAREAQPPARRLPAMAMSSDDQPPSPSSAAQPVGADRSSGDPGRRRAHVDVDRPGDGLKGRAENGSSHGSDNGAQNSGGGDGNRNAALHKLRASAAGCRECPLGALATQTVWGEGPADAQLMLVGEQPGDQEDLQGRPFVGPAGQLLDRGMRELGWDRSLAYVTNAVKHFKYEPRGKRRIHKTPAQREADACEHWLDSEIAVVRPQAIVALGATAARQLLGRPVAVTRERGQWLTRGDGLQVLVTLHPSALLRLEPADRDAAYAAWLADLRLADRFAVAGAREVAAVPAVADDAVVYGGAPSAAPTSERAATSTGSPLPTSDAPPSQRGCA